MTDPTAVRFTTAIGTPLTDEETLHEDGLAKHLSDQLGHGFEGILVAGTMGAMPLLTGNTYRRLVTRTVELARNKAEILAGAGDTGFTRTRERIRFLNTLPINGVAVLAPFFWSFPQPHLVSYYRALADECVSPLYLYDLPQVTGTKLEMDTVLALAEHPNIKGIKVSCEFTFTRQLMDRLGDRPFRVIVAQPDLVDVLLRSGIREHLDGMWAICPGWTRALRQAAASGDWEAASRYQQKITHLRNRIGAMGFGVFTELMNARGVPGRFAPRPHATLSGEQRQQLLQDPVVAELLRDDPAA
ncbi:MAG: dihydrodipicolinate synthase family protein [Kiritimatiellae bacterium]|nr:dihydrodipicolinate synthase family protein [Kiritimatiellia bacterium]